MIPVKLKLSNFTSYGQNPPELDFTQFKLAAISGQNGAGKSSLLDAITWCVWGDSRAGESSDALVRLGSNQMYVEFSFELDNHIYTVKRLRSKKSGGHSTLELWSNSHNLTEGTIKSTQQKIVDTLHLTFETFTNSSFIRQGNAGEFTTKGPTDRKRILADILGLDHYDKLEEKAKEKSKEAQTKLTLLDYQVLEIEAELSTKEEKQKELEQAEIEAKKIQQELKETESLIKTIEEEKQLLLSTIQSLKQKVSQIEEVKKEIAEIKLQIDLKQKAKEEYQTLLNQKNEIEQKYKQLLKLQTEKKELEVKRSELIKVKDELAEIQKKIIELENRRQSAITTLEVEIKKYQTQNEQLQQEIEQLKNRKDICPTCKQPIGLEINKEIIAKNKKQIEENYQKLQTLNEKLKKCQTFELKEQKEANQKELEVKKLEEETKNWGDLNREIILLDKYQDLYTKLQQAETAVKTHQEAITDLEKIAQAKQLQIKDVSKHLEELEVFENKLKEVENRIYAKQIIKDELTQKALDARAKVGAATQLKTRFEQLEDLFKKKSEEKKKLNEEKQIYEELALAFGKKGIQAMIIEQAIPEIEDEANKLLDKLTEGRMKVSFLTQKETKTKVMGIDGKKDHATVETLDIIISDEMGERSYEMYSVDGSELVYLRDRGQIKSLPIQELWNDKCQNETDGDYQFQKSDVETLCYVNGKVVWQKITKILRHKAPLKLLEVKCGPGNYSIRLTKNHSIYVITPTGLQVKCTKDLKPGDFLLSPKRIPKNRDVNNLDFINYISEDFIEQRRINHKELKWNDSYIWSRKDQKINRNILVDASLGELLGIATAEGSGIKAYTISAGTSKQLANTTTSLGSYIFGTPQRVLNLISKQSLEKYMQKYPGLSSITPQAQYRPFIGGRLVSHIMKNIVGEKASLKKVPTCIFNAPKETQLAFLKGLVLGDGYIRSKSKNSKSEVGITTISHRLAGEVLFLCRQLGVWARIENHGEEGFRRGMNHQKSYRIVISGKQNLEILGFVKIVSKSDGITKYEGIPYSLVGVKRKSGKRFKRDAIDKLFSCGVERIPKSVKEAYLRIQNLVQDWNILEVKEIKEVSPKSDYVYDLMVPKNNSFVAGNGAILVHNSGGETFRVNFAIRLAISKLLTHRAGAKLQFLVVDEGFGTQDAPGRARLVEVLDTIKNDFEKILIITHIEELKEEFPTRIEVTKGSTGSTFEVVGN